MNYTLLRQGDRLPSAGVLQKLLNRCGSALTPDGIFGPRTAAAVQQFQRPRHLSVDGVVGRLTRILRARLFRQTPIGNLGLYVAVLLNKF